MLDPYTLSNPKSILVYISALFLILLVYIWLFVHFHTFKRQPNEIQALKKEILDLENPSLGIQALLNKFPNLLKPSRPNFFSNHGHLITSLSILVSTIGTEIGAIIVFLSDNSPSRAENIAGFYIVAIPSFIIIGTLFSASDMSLNNKYSTCLLFFTVIPTSFIMWISTILYQNDDYFYIGLLISIGFPATVLYWMSLIMVYSYNKRSYQYFSVICCLIVIVPLGYMWPLYTTEGLSGTTFWIACGGVVFIGFFLLFLWFSQFAFKFGKELFLLIKEIRKFNGYDLAQYLYSVSFVLGFCVLGFFTVKNLDSSNNWEGGFVLGCFTIVGFTIFGTVFVHRIILYISEPGVEDVNIRDIILSKAPPGSLLQAQHLKKKNKYLGLIVVFGIIIICSISIPILITAEEKSTESAGITIIIGLIFILLIIIVLIELKSVLRQHGDIFISFSLSYCWIFCLFPILCLVPTILSLSESDRDKQKTATWSIGFLFFIFMIGVSAASITLNLIFRRLENEKIAKYSCEQVCDILAEKGVKVKLTILRSIYDNFRISGAEPVEKVLNNATVFYYHELDKDSDLRFSKEILTLREISKLKAHKKPPVVEKVEVRTRKAAKFIMFVKKFFERKEEVNEKVPKEIKEEEQLMGFDMPDIIFGNKVLNGKEPKEDKNWDQMFKEKIIKQQELYTNTVKPKDFEKELNVPIEEQSKRLEDIKEIQLKPNLLEELISCTHLKVLNSSNQVKTKWLKAVFRIFSNGFISQDPTPWMDLGDFRHFIRLSGMKSYISNATCDLLYLKFTSFFNPITKKKILIKLDFQRFSEVLLKELGKYRYSHLPIEEANDKVFSEVLYPNLVCNFLYLSKYYPCHIFDDNENNVEVMHSNEESKNDKENIEKEISQRNCFDDKELFLGHNTSKIIYNMITLKERTAEGKFYIEEDEIVSCARLKEFLYNNIADKLSKCVGKCIKGFLRCLGKGFDMCFNYLMPTDSSSEKGAFKKKIDIDEEVFERRASPSWEVICNIIITSFIKIDAEARENANNIQPKMQLNFSNIAGIIGHLVEIYSFSSVGFLKHVGWLGIGGLNRGSSIILVTNDEYWKEIYWICFFFSIIFFFLVFPATNYIKKGRLGLNEDFTKAYFPKFQFFLSKFLSFLGKTMYLTIISAMLSAFSCVYKDGGWKLSKQNNIECLDKEHNMYIVLSVLSLLVYYPFATLLYPNIAFQNKALDLKYDTTYLVLESQGKVIIAIFAVFFDVEQFILLNLVVSIGVSGILFVINLRMKPCLIKSYNLWKTGGFLVPIWICSCGLLNYYVTDMHIVSIAISCLLVIGLGVILGILLALHKKYYWLDCLSRLRTMKTLAKKSKNIEDLDISIKSDVLSQSELDNTKQICNGEIANPSNSFS